MFSVEIETERRDSLWVDVAAESEQEAMQKVRQALFDKRDTPLCQLVELPIDGESAPLQRTMWQDTYTLTGRKPTTNKLPATQEAITPPTPGAAGGRRELLTEVKLRRKYTPLHGADGARVYSRIGELDYTVYFRFAGGECYSHICVSAPTPEAARAKAEEQCAVEGIDCEVLYVKDYDEEEVLM
jgi:hypothetical protein